MTDYVFAALFLGLVVAVGGCLVLLVSGLALWLWDTFVDRDRPHDPKTCAFCRSGHWDVPKERQP